MMIKIGSHVSMSAPDYLLGSLNEALSYQANAFMLYTGAPQNTRRKEVSDEHIALFHQALQDNNIDIDNIIIHAPYIINLANTIKEETFELATSFLAQEIKRVARLGLKYIVLHPGSHVKAGSEVGLAKIVEGLNIALKQANINDTKVMILLETMAGKGSECGCSFDEIAYIINNCDYQEHLGVCMDTCHLHDAGYDLSDFDEVLNQFSNKIDFNKLKCIHINDSKNVCGAHKDRHENIGFGHIGFDNLCKIVHHPKLNEVVKILETPYVNGHAPYKNEIAMLLKQTFDENVLSEFQDN